jgi:hypothetical protein
MMDQAQWERLLPKLLRGAGLPDGMFSNKNPNLGKFWVGLAMEIVRIFYSEWEFLCPFGTFYGKWVYFVVIWEYFSTVWYVVPRKIWQGDQMRL